MNAIMHRLLDGIRRFQKEVYPQDRELYERLGKSQSPETFFITCADSRIDPFTITGSKAGDLFTLRNAGNMVLPYNEEDSCPTAAALEFAIVVVEIKRIVICGHTDCGAMRAALHPETIEHLPALKQWLAHAGAVRRQVMAGGAVDEESLFLRMVKGNVVAQLNNLTTHPSVIAALEKNRLELKGLFYNIGTGEFEQVTLEPGTEPVWEKV
jgi:carbonic anhydrase